MADRSAWPTIDSARPIVADHGSAPPPGRAVRTWLWLCAALIVAMVAIGGITRLTESGLSITEWRPVTGIVPPLDEAAWQAEFEKYKRIPEFRTKNASMTLAEFKAIFWWEYVHRLWGRLIGAAFALPFLWFLATRAVRGALAWKLAGVLALGGMQGAIGWWMVASGLVDRIDVSPYRLALHLTLALVIYAAVVWIALDLGWPRAARPARRLAASLSALLVLILTTTVAGAFVAGTDAGLVYNTFPLMDGRLVPAGYLDLAPWWRNMFENVAAVQFNHRFLAMVTLVITLAVAAAMRRVPIPIVRDAALVLAACALAQVAIGIATLILAVPLILGVLHQLGAVALLTAALVARHVVARPIVSTAPAP
jgi:cytochrome c oxidase assembly protein subunit 15